MSLYIRIKRRNQTIFQHVEPSDTFLSVKQKVGELLNVEPAIITFYAPSEEKDSDDSQPNKEHELVDGATITDQQVENDSVIYMVFRRDGSEEPIEIDLPGAVIPVTEG